MALQTFTDAGEMIAKTGVSREIDDAVHRLDHVAAPQSSIAVEHGSSRKMQCRHAVNGASGERKRFAPIQFMDRTDAPGSEQPGDSDRNNKLT